MTKRNLYRRDLWKELYRLYVIERMSLEDIAEKMGYSNDSAVYNAMTSVHIGTGRRQDLYNPNAKVMFSDEQEQILLGGFLGDGAIIDRNSRNPIYSETHSTHQLEYISWKQAKLYPFVKKVYVGHKNTQAYIRSVALPQLRYYRGVFYPNGDKTIPVETLSWLDDLAVAVWYMDDGSISKKSNLIRIATCSFETRVVGMLQGWLSGKYDINSYITYDKGKYPTLCIFKESNDKFLSVVEPHIIPSMRYKLGQL